MVLTTSKVEIHEGPTAKSKEIEQFRPCELWCWAGLPSKRGFNSEEKLVGVESKLNRLWAMETKDWEDQDKNWEVNRARKLQKASHQILAHYVKTIEDTGDLLN